MVCRLSCTLPFRQAGSGDSRAAGGAGRAHGSRLRARWVFRTLLPHEGSFSGRQPGFRQSSSQTPVTDPKHWDPNGDAGGGAPLGGDTGGWSAPRG